MELTGWQWIPGERPDLVAEGASDTVVLELPGRPDAEFREGQDAAVSALVERSQRALVVQRTGWGKSAVYFVATGTFTDDTTQDLSADVAWTSSNTPVATVSATGVVKALVAGSTTITNTVDGVGGAASLRVGL